ncbi:high-potential iron-sulfur protein [Halovivax limisalsi]|uniref:high-potential iron-sulfur protein n=1 Tax=Halovivax limisalsi TaxID=1453760 RepID=UPI003CCCB921
MENRDESAPPSRRRLLYLAAGGSIAGLSGCLNLPPADGELAHREPPADYCLDDLEEDVPESERTSLSISGIDRKPPGELTSKQEAGYVCHAVDGNLCGNCRFYIDDKNGDAIGACTEVAGQVRSVDWCGLWAPREEIATDEAAESVEIEPGTRIEFDGQTSGWVGIAPSSIEGLTNPSLVLHDGESYEIGWSQGDGAPHNIAIYGDSNEVIDGLQTPIVEDPGDDQWLEFEANSEMVTYICEVHPNTMVGEIDLA